MSHGIRAWAWILCFLFIGMGELPLEGASYKPKASLRTIRVNSIEYVDVIRELGRFGMKSIWLSKKRLRMQGSYTRIEFESEKKEISVNGLKVFMGDAVYVRTSRFYISAQDLEKVITPILRAPETKAPRVIVLDPGHGGRDTGTISKALGAQEKKYTLDLALRVRRRLTAHGYQVVMTRSTDNFISLKNRPRVAERVKADLFISIHLNSAQSTSVKGIETYVVTPQYQRSTSGGLINGKSVPGNRNDELNTLLGYHIHRKLIEQTRAVDRGLKKARFLVIAEAKMPGVLIEAGFMSNLEEARKIKSVVYQEQLAAAITNGILSYAQAVRN